MIDRGTGEKYAKDIERTALKNPGWRGLGDRTECYPRGGKDEGGVEHLCD